MLTRKRRSTQSPSIIRSLRVLSCSSTQWICFLKSTCDCYLSVPSFPVAATFVFCLLVMMLFQFHCNTFVSLFFSRSRNTAKLLLLWTLFLRALSALTKFKVFSFCSTALVWECLSQSQRSAISVVFWLMRWVRHTSPSHD